MPVNDRYPLDDVLAECRRYVELRGRRVFVEYVMLAGVNDAPEQAEELAKLLDPEAFKVNLIPYNPTGSEYKGTDRAGIEKFRHLLGAGRCSRHRQAHTRARDRGGMWAVGGGRRPAQKQPRSGFDPRLLPVTIEIPSGDDVLGRAVRFLLEGGDDKAAAVLVNSTLDVVVDYVQKPRWEGDAGWARVIYAVFANREGYEILTTAEETISDDHGIRAAVNRALSAVTPRDMEAQVEVRFDQTPVAEGWREDVAQYLLRAEVHNQAPGPPATVRLWQNLRFRSESERRIAQALDRAGVLFFPNCRARVTSDKKRATVEPDFLVCSNGRWGILEVDGEPYHPPSRTVHDHTRDRVFKGHGIVLVEHFDASECFENPDEVVRKFLALLNRL